MHVLAHHATNSVYFVMLRPDIGPFKDSILIRRAPKTQDLHEIHIFFIAWVMNAAWNFIGHLWNCTCNVVAVKDT